VARTGVFAVPEKYTQSQIAEALMSVAANILHTRLNRASALNLAGALGVYINDPQNTNFAPGGNLEVNTSFISLVTEKASLLALASTDPDAAKSAARAEMDRYNASGAPLSAAAMAALGLPTGHAGGGSGQGRSDGSSERPSSSSYAYGQATPLSATSASNFAQELGLGPGYAGFFVGASPGMRDALRDAIKNGAAIGEDKVKNMRDVSAVLGAIRAGKLKPDDPRIPDSVKKIIKDMKEKGIDPATADHKVIKKYLDDNPKALEAAKKQDALDRKDTNGMSEEQKKAKIENETPKTVTPSRKKASAKVEAPTATL
jgi:hypothetical protein